jgi:UDPglucose 6-dehydrogenase
VHDPEALENVRKLYGNKLSYFEQPYGALEGADALAIMTEWKQFLQPDFSVMKGLMRAAVVFDGRNLYNPAHMRAAGFQYQSIGRANVG